ncbi:nicotinate-nucleotide--dimethylbenzimidazole phosphoribosyltransferase [Anaeroselena agilis]|uniref:Nicotinate-nucleotide--dimethylbenzimidazole phosphoribosyltransferase n=1 Tax=Anaeroselena agilis TaxID=3063788 RepID=A0ABU3NS69_9FIRM|nr:nicotinate-nucleotide--dimethylbenzimidazole phosphoribosyltransferase [Selenomonadales bacterium 4137-cl]
MAYQEKVDLLVDGMAKPPGSLGLLEKHVKRVLLCWGEMQVLKPYHLIFAADNGVVEEGVAAFPPVITYLQAQNMVAGRATINAFCRCFNIPCEVIDVGVNTIEPVGTNLKPANGSRNFTKEPAMSETEYEYVGKAVACRVQRLVEEHGCNLFSFGEMGIGNTTTSSAVLHGLTGIEPEFVVGYGASPPNGELVRRKRNTIVKGLELHKEVMLSVHDILRCLGGLDIAAMCAAMLKCTELRVPFVIDGFISAVAFACASRINERAKRYAIPSHLSKEPGMTYALLLGGILADEVPIRANMALGEGTGAVLMVGLLKAMLHAIESTARMSEFELGGDAAVKVAEQIGSA